MGKTCFHDGFGGGIQYLREYQSKFGLAEISLACKSPDGFNIGAWVFFQKERLTKKALKTAMDNKTLEILNSITSKSNYRSLDVAIYLIEQYVDKYGNTPISYRYRTIEGIPIGVWGVKIRKMANKNELSLADKDKLSKKGFVFNPAVAVHQTTDYLDGLLELKASLHNLSYKNISKNTTSLSCYPIGYWLYERLVDMRKGTLGLNRFNEMLENNFLPHMTHEKMYWFEGLNSLGDAIKVGDINNIEFDYVDENGFHLGNWISYIREVFQRGLLQGKRQDTLKSIGYDISLNKDSDWDGGYHSLLSHLMLHPNKPILDVTVTASGFPIGRWLRNTLRLLVNDHLSSDRALMLKSTGVKLSSCQISKWLRALSVSEHLYFKQRIQIPTTGCDTKCGVLIKVDKSLLKYKRKSVIGKNCLERENWITGIGYISAYVSEGRTYKDIMQVSNHSMFDFNDWLKNVRCLLDIGSIGIAKVWVLESFGIVPTLQKMISANTAHPTMKLSDWLKVRKNVSGKVN